jgi:hypothetical protein
MAGGLIAVACRPNYAAGAFMGKGAACFWRPIDMNSAVNRKNRQKPTFSWQDIYERTTRARRRQQAGVCSASTSVLLAQKISVHARGELALHEKCRRSDQTTVANVS